MSSRVGSGELQASTSPIMRGRRGQSLNGSCLSRSCDNRHHKLGSSHHLTRQYARLTNDFGKGGVSTVSPGGKTSSTVILFKEAGASSLIIQSTFTCSLTARCPTFETVKYSPCCGLPPLSPSSLSAGPLIRIHSFDPEPRLPETVVRLIANMPPTANAPAMTERFILPNGSVLPRRTGGKETLNDRDVDWN
jgi:hypothetical protein